MAISHVTKLVAFGFVGMAISAYIPLVALMVCGTVLGTWLGKHALNRIPEKLFRQIFRVLLTLLAIRLLVGAATELGWLDGIF
jgi:uncharacterized membrane protein YfcA